MDMNGVKVKVTYIETQFVTSDAAGFKDLVQRLTGRAVDDASAPAPHRLRLRPCRASATSAGPQGCSYATPSSVAPAPCQLLEELNNDMTDGGCNDFPY